MFVKRTFFLIVILFVFLLPLFASASITVGTIDATYKIAKGTESGVGRFNFATAQGNVSVTDTALTGYAWGENHGWINLAPTNGGVENDAEGNLTGYAWGEGSGWVNFDASSSGQQVTIDSNGYFNGYAWSQNLGWISFNCADPGTCGVEDYKVRTDWRPQSTRPECSNGEDDDNDGNTDYPADSGCASVAGTSEGEETDTTGGDGDSSSSSSSSTGDDTTGDTTGTDTTGGDTDGTTGDIDTTGTDGGTDTTGTDGGTDTGGDTDGTTGDTTDSTGDTGGSTGDATGDTGGGFFGGGGGGGKVVEYVSSVVSVVEEQVAQSVEAVSEVVNTVSLGTQKVLKNETVSVATKVVTTAGAVAGGAASASVLFLTPLSLVDLFLVPLRIWSVLISALGLRRRWKPWGVVYDSVTKQPLDPAYVTVFDETGKTINTSITDLEGRYGFLLPPGKYRIEAKKTNYTFPSTKLLGKESDVLYSNLYFGDSFFTLDGGEVVTRNIPLDPIAFDWNEYAKQQQGLTSLSHRRLVFEKVQAVLFVVGFILSIIAYLFVSAPYNTIILVAYLVTLVLRYIGFKPKTSGAVIEKATGTPLPFAIVRVYSQALGREMTHRVTDSLGRYYCLVPEGTYTVSVEKKIGENEYKTVYTSEPFFAKKGIVKKSLSV